MHYQLKVGEQEFAVAVEARPGGGFHVAVNGKPYDVTLVPEGPLKAAARVAADTGRAPSTGAPVGPSAGDTVVGGAVLAPIPGLIVAVTVQVGDRVQAGQAVAVMEAMKMENRLTAHRDGVVKEIRVQKGSEVATGDVILHIE